MPTCRGSGGKPLCDSTAHGSGGKPVCDSTARASVPINESSQRSSRCHSWGAGVNNGCEQLVPASSGSATGSAIQPSTSHTPSKHSRASSAMHALHFNSSSVVDTSFGFAHTTSLFDTPRIQYRGPCRVIQSAQYRRSSSCGPV